MNRQNLNVAGSVALLLIILGLWLWLRPVTTEPTGKDGVGPSHTGSSTQAHVPGVPLSTGTQANSQTADKANNKFWGLTLDEFAAKAFSAKIEFYGKAVDQFGKPVPNPDVIYNAATSVMDDGGKNNTTQGDAEGNIRIAGLAGATLYVEVRKTGYYRTEKSLGSFRYGTPSGQYPAPTKDKPFIFVLRKMGETEPLFYAGTRDYQLTKDGQPLEINLETGKRVSGDQGNIYVERWANDKTKDEKGHFDWRLRISVPNGGLVERHEDFVFVAPEYGYRPSEEINMPASLDEKWQYTVSKSFFVKLPDGRYARINATVQAGHNNTPLTLDSYLNLTPGSRNLEYDPAKRIQ